MKKDSKTDRLKQLSLVKPPLVAHISLGSAFAKCLLRFSA